MPTQYQSYALIKLSYFVMYKMSFTVLIQNSF